MDTKNYWGDYMVKMSKKERKKMFNNDPVLMAKHNLGINAERVGMFQNVHEQSIHKLRYKINEMLNPPGDKSVYEEGMQWYDKVKFKSILFKHGIKVPETLFFIDKVDQIETFIEQMDKIDRCIVKPNNESMGKHILILEKDSTVWLEPDDTEWDYDQLRKHLNVILTETTPLIRRGALLEERVYTHPDLNVWNPFKKTICDMRLYVLYGMVLFGKFRVPTKKSRGLGNTGQGACCFHVDETGKIVISNMMRNTVDKHPDTKESLIGWQIPFWDEMCLTALQIHKMFHQKFHSVDLTVDLEGKTSVIESERIPSLNNTSSQGCTYILNKIHELSGGSY